ncbi:hypothetical protein [Rhizobium sp. GN54]|uniref:hypothetical protein n=1 Tax=Rhizobium sp. GN54 TaxID=2898150 RepID=UPI001E3199B1|nr:hypothetical protein [Rhizobium sp. GN54]MCD2184589.1 hypothetical protein [Rhizobium sp. GN54]
MARRSSRHLKMYGSERETFLRAATAMHRVLRDLMAELATSGDDYLAVSELSQAVCDAVERLTGEVPPWAQVAMSMPNGPRSA